MEKLNPVFKNFQRKITPYLDGALSPEETSEFEAFISTHPDFEAMIQNKQAEIAMIKQMIPQVNPKEESLESLAFEMRSSIFNLLKDEPQGFFDGIKIKIEEWFNR